MMNPVRIIVDSSADLSEALKKRLMVVPMTVSFGDTEYIDGVTITHHVFYEKLIESDVLPTTSQPSPDAFAKVFEEVKRAGETGIVLTVSSKLSGTYQSACIAAQDYDNVYIVDTKSVAIGIGILAELALNWVDEGMDAASIVTQLEREKENIRLIAMLDTLEYLKKGGRISKAVAFAGGLLSIKPVVCIQDGEILILGKARGSRQGNNLLIKEIENAGGINFDQPLLLGYTGLSDLLLHKYVADSAFIWEGNVPCLSVTPIGSVVGTHAGPGAIAVAFFKN